MFSALFAQGQAIFFAANSNAAVAGGKSGKAALKPL